MEAESRTRIVLTCALIRCADDTTKQQYISNNCNNPSGVGVEVSFAVFNWKPFGLKHFPHINLTCSQSRRKGRWRNSSDTGSQYCYVKRCLRIN